MKCTGAPPAGAGSPSTRSRSQRRRQNGQPQTRHVRARERAERRHVETRSLGLGYAWHRVTVARMPKDPFHHVGATKKRSPASIIGIRPRAGHVTLPNALYAALRAFMMSVPSSVLLVPPGRQSPCESVGFVARENELDVVTVLSQCTIGTYGNIQACASIRSEVQREDPRDDPRFAVDRCAGPGTMNFQHRVRGHSAKLWRQAA